MVLPRKDYCALQSLLKPDPVSEEEIKADINSRFSLEQQIEMKKQHQERINKHRERTVEPIAYIAGLGWIVF